jgi:hypothetical protein
VDKANLRLKRETRWSLLLLAGTLGICAAFVSAIASTDWGQERIGRLQRQWAPPAPGRAIGIWRRDSRLGFSHVPAAAGTHGTSDFTVRYTIDETGCRSTPDRAHGQGSVLFLGDSFTFGHGVEDTQAYPARLASEFWPHVKVRNCAVMGWSTGQSYLALEQALAKRPLPTAVLYGWTGADLRRNYLRKSWLAALGAYGMRNTHFEVAPGGVDYRGTVGPEAGIPDGTLRLEEREMAVTQALVRSMAHACAQRSVRFSVVLLAARDPHDPLGDWLAAEGPGNGIGVLDLRGVRGPYFKNDGHPKPAWHGAIARSLAHGAAGLVSHPVPPVIPTPRRL